MKILLVLRTPWKSSKTICQAMSRNSRILFRPFGFALGVTAFSLRLKRILESSFIVSYIVEKPIARKKEAMLNLKPNILERDGKKSFVVLTYEEYLSIEEALEDADDLQCLKEARAEEWNAPTTSLDSVRKTLTL